MSDENSTAEGARLLLERLARVHADDWRVTLQRAHSYEARLTHPASVGLIIENVPAHLSNVELAEFFEMHIATTREFAIASSAPPIEHYDLVHGLRAVWVTVDASFRLARSLTAVLVDCGHLTADEARWLTALTEPT